jgi:hypothetical protein
MNRRAIRGVHGGKNDGEWRRTIIVCQGGLSRGYLSQGGGNRTAPLFTAQTGTNGCKQLKVKSTIMSGSC